MVKLNFEKVELVVGWVCDKKIIGYCIFKEMNVCEMFIIVLV